MLPPGQTPENLKVYNNFSLWSKRGMHRSDLINQKIVDFDNRVISISGINHCHGHIEFSGDFKFKGQGVLIADSFSINGSMAKQDTKDLIVLYARTGKITVNSKDEIQAALIAVNKNFSGTIEATQPLNLTGLILADRINLNNWSHHEHRAIYDPVFSKPEEAYQISFSPWLNQRSGQIK